MKRTIINLFFALAFLSGMALITSCGGDSHDADHAEQHENGEDHDHAEADEDHGHEHAEGEEEVDKTGPEYTSAYVCPMHCDGSGSEEAGKCPVCGMEYVASADAPGHDEDGEEHHHDGDGDDHDHN